MKKYICSICGYEYYEEKGIPGDGIKPGTKWEELPDGWVCMMCGAPKVMFDPEETGAMSDDSIDNNESTGTVPVGKLSFLQMSALCSNLSKGCEKQYRLEEAGLFSDLADYFAGKSEPLEGNGLADIGNLIENDINKQFKTAGDIVKGEGDRGALRALVWGEKVTKIIKTVLMRYEKSGNNLLEDTKIHVCEICGFIYIGEEPPEVCPVCKVPRFKIAQVKRS